MECFFFVNGSRKILYPLVCWVGVFVYVVVVFVFFFFFNCDIAVLPRLRITSFLGLPGDRLCPRSASRRGTSGAGGVSQTTCKIPKRIAGVTGRS